MSTLLVWNMHGIGKSWNWLRRLIQKYDVHLIAISETWLKEELSN